MLFTLPFVFNLVTNANYSQPVLRSLPGGWTEHEVQGHRYFYHAATKIAKINYEIDSAHVPEVYINRWIDSRSERGGKYA